MEDNFKVNGQGFEYSRRLHSKMADKRRRTYQQFETLGS